MELADDFYDGVLIGAVGKRSNEQILIGLREFRGARFIDIRAYFETDDGEWRPTKKGVTLPIDAFPEFAETVAGLGETLGFGEKAAEE